MEERQISKAVIKRLPRYYRYLGEILDSGMERISSGELSSRMKVTASQIRQDLNHFGGFGQQGYGYKEKGGTHEKFADQMAKKTVINRLCKMITNTYGDEAVIDTFERLEEVEGEDRIAADVVYEISQNANKEEFFIEEPAQIEEKTPAPTMADMTKAPEKEPVPAEKNEKPLPDFMKDGGM